MKNINTLSGLSVANFSKQIDGKETALYTLCNKVGAELAITNYGAKIVSLMVPDKNGKMTDVVTGHNSIGFNAVVWDAKQIDEQTIELKYTSADGEEGFPGELKTTVTYHLTNENEVVISYQASTDKPTVLNLTNHSYFNLSGAGDPYIGDHILTINADYYLPTDNTAIPYGPKEKVEGTPMDFRTPHEVGERINDNFEQLIFGKGYDHTYILNKEDNELSYCARCSSPKTGIVMETYTTQPGVQLYTGNWMTGNFEGKNGQRYPERAALCLETQHFPDSPNKPEYPTTELRPGEVFQSTTIYKFSVE